MKGKHFKQKVKSFEDIKGFLISRTKQLLGNSISRCTGGAI